MDVICAAILIVLAVLLRSAYAARSKTLGPEKFGRLEAGGDSPLLGKPTMESVYWMIAPIARTLARAGVTANAVTATSLLLGAIAGISLIRGHVGLAACFSAVSALCDAIDGFVARESGTQSEAGQVFDASVDRYNEFFFLLGLAFLFRGSSLVLVLVFVTLHGSFMVSYASARAEALRLSPPRGWMRRPERATYLTAGAALSPIAALLAEFLGAPGSQAASLPILAALLIVGVGANISAVRRLVSLARLATERDRSCSVEFAATPDATTPKAPPATRWLERLARR